MSQYKQGDIVKALHDIPLLGVTIPTGTEGEVIKQDGHEVQVRFKDAEKPAVVFDVHLFKVESPPTLNATDNLTAADAQPVTTITASQWTPELAAQVASGQVVVTWRDLVIKSVVTEGHNKGLYHCVTADGRLSHNHYFEPYSRFTVTRLPQPVTVAESAGDVWAALSEKHQLALQNWIGVDRHVVNEIEKHLRDKGLINIVRIDHNRHQNMITAFGCEVLAAGEVTPQPAASVQGAGEDDWQSAAESANNLYLAEKERYNNLYNEYIDDQNQHEELIHRTLYLLGVDPSDWAASEAGIESAVKSNLQIGEPQMSKIEDWTDQNAPNEGSVTEHMFKLLERAQKAEAELAATRDQLAVAVGAVEEALAYCRTGSQSDAMAHMSREMWLEMMRNNAARELVQALAKLQAGEAGVK